MSVRELVIICLLFSFTQACSSPQNQASAKCMEQADLVYLSKSDYNADISSDCVNSRADGKPSNVPSNTILETAALQAVASILNSSTH